MIAPSHGVIWRKDPMKIVNAYLGWAQNETRKKAVVFYETMWGATEKMAHAIAAALADAGVETKLYDVVKADRTDLATDLLDARGFLIGSSTHDNDMLPTIAGFLEFLKGLKPKNRVAAVFGSYGWGGGAVKEIEGIVKEAGIEQAQPSLSVKFMPNPDELKACYDFGRTFAKKISS
jgi:flavorubredoxin